MEWSARVEWSTHEPYAVDDVDDLITKLEPQFPAIGREHVPTGVAETWGAHLWIEADTMRAGVDEALRLIEEATGLPATGVEVLAWTVFEHRVDQG